MTDRSRVPRGIDNCNSYLITTVAYFQQGMPTNNATRLGISVEEVTQWKDYLTEWSPLYLLYSDKKNSRTTAVIDQLYDIIDRVILFDQTNHILDRIAVSLNVTIVDLETFNIKKGALQKDTRTVPQKPISEQVTVTFKPIGGGSVNIKCYSTTGARPAIYEDADSVQFVYQVGGTPPASALASGMNKDLSTKGAFNLALGADAAGKTLYIFFRWFNTKHPELAGPWSGLQTTWLL